MIFPFIVLDCLQSAFSCKICPFLIPVSATATNDATIRDLDEARIDGHIFSFRACALVCRGSRAWVTRGVPLQRKMIDCSQSISLCLLEVLFLVDPCNYNCFNFKSFRSRFWTNNCNLIGRFYSSLSACVKNCDLLM